MTFRNLTPFAFVRDVTASIAFYRTLGFEAANTFTPEGETAPAWAWLRSDGAHLMIAKATDPTDAERPVMFYLYCDDVAAKHAELAAAGVEVSAVTYPFYAPRGEFRVNDPDGYALWITHT